MKRGHIIFFRKTGSRGFDTKGKAVTASQDSTNFKKVLLLPAFYMAKGLEFDQVFAVFPGTDRSPIVQRARYIRGNQGAA